MLYGPYIKSLRSWDGSGGLSSTSTATIYSFQGPSNSKIWAGDPTGYRIRGAVIALRREQAEQVQVER